jgi:TRAP-type mannitol/chloroaromatic compound transport system permease small subunit
MARAGGRADQRTECRGPQGVQHQLERVLEIQWYLFAAVFLLAAGYTMLRQEHVKIDVISGRFTKRTQVWIDIIGLAFFVLPLVYTVIHLSLPLAIRSYVMNEYSSNAGGLIRWPVFALLPLGFLLLGIQASRN